jgi:hypothetical protein
LAFWEGALGRFELELEVKRVQFSIGPPVGAHLLLTYLRRERKLEFTLDDVPAPLPSHAAELFALRATASPLLVIDPGDLQKGHTPVPRSTHCGRTLTQDCLMRSPLLSEVERTLQWMSRLKLLHECLPYRIPEMMMS